MVKEKAGTRADVRVDVHHDAIGGLAVGVGCDHRHLPRRRGAVLEQAIREGVLDELAERGYNGLTFEGVAARAGTGKSTLYRRWADKPTMVVDCLSAAMPAPDAHCLHGDLREDLVTVLHAYALACAGVAGVALRAVCGEAPRCPELEHLWRERVAEPRLEVIREVVQRAIEHGEARPGATERECLLTGPAMVGQIYMATDEAPTLDDVARVVDHVIMPMIEARG
ncbi:TetR/AcrR family transcriptional regulator [Yinghuangia sp. ASG 101]|uniref:TetR/AcrR family transcriptional regulator n=1 Tax=Yinghuangia sp. ASG 101 TaxID=2896848 RepID=UPI001E2ADFA3|nr:TetR/AcrR family transcriptional regulator [Yinghuangia sp. ASG 101]UGQ10292.1 TetR/AcrR family transcriptional regulator [Yinghuangia sp. ASG 101]